ncbi:hypothetical protein ACFQH2_11730 [Natronoarchaeum sp. GCM10025703]|uniref:hypothetical protein n=1 Tax=Natronoarchaeum sp. GCM10025703 TaxID=3252685 RepID=UPI0036243720
MPEIVVETRACSEDLREADVEALGSVLLGTDVDWGILTNGRQFVFAGVDETGTLERRPVELTDSPTGWTWCRDTRSRWHRDESSGAKSDTVPQ